MPTYDPLTHSELRVSGFWGDIEKLIKLAKKLDAKVEFIGIHPDPNDGHYFEFKKPVDYQGGLVIEANGQTGYHIPKKRPSRSRA